MKTHKILIYLSFFLLAGVVVSCEDFLDIEPQQAVSDEAVYSTHDGVVNVLYGAYERIAGPQLWAGTSVFQSDLLANEDELNWTGTFLPYRQMNWKAMDANDGTVTAKWLRSYQTINLVNNVLDNLQVVNEEQRARVEGEARFIRGILYFHLVRFFAAPYVAGQPNDQPGVPLVLTPTVGVSDDDFVSRAPVSEVYQQVLTDLNQAKSLLSDMPATAGANEGRATSSTAAAFLAQVHMSMENWEQAAQEADFVVSNFGGYDALNETPRAAFNNDSYTSEDVFMIQQTAISNAGQANAGIATFFASLPGLGRGDVIIGDAYFDYFEPDDLRIQITDDPSITSIQDVPTMIYVGVGTNPGNLMSSKWGKHDANIPVIRLAEMILTRAEANLRNGSTIGAEPLADVNAIRERAGVDPFESLTLEETQNEMFRELSFEGHTLFILKRFRGSTVAPPGSPWAGEVIQWDDPRLVLPIPQREMDVNPNLVQNPAYD